MSEAEPIPIHKAKTHFSGLVARAERDEQIVVRRGSVPVAKIVAYHPPATRKPGSLSGAIAMAPDFDDYLT